MGLAAAHIMGRDHYIILAGRTRSKLENAVKELQCILHVCLSHAAVYNAKAVIQTCFEGQGSIYEENHEIHQTDAQIPTGKCSV